jgi:predicted nucleotidyltransferase component of viral defense system
MGQISLLNRAAQLAQEQGAPVNTLMKELLHYEILYALGQSGVLENLVFQGGTALRLCYGGLRYSEDLDFVSGHSIPELPLQAFIDLLTRQIAQAYGLEVEVAAPARGEKENNNKVTVERWKAKIKVPNPNPAIKQAQFINIEIASVPAYERNYLPVVQNYPGMAIHLRQMLIAVEKESEILADKIIALGARDYVKARDVWDIKFLRDKGVALNQDLIDKKIKDYAIDEKIFMDSLLKRSEYLSTEKAKKEFIGEMSRFVNSGILKMFAMPGFVDNYLSCSANMAKQYVNA